MKKIMNALVIVMAVLVATAVFSAEYAVRIGDMELGRVRTEYNKNGWRSVSEIQYGEKYVVETRTTYGKNGFFSVYEAVFKTNNEIVAKILGINKNGRVLVTLYAYSDAKNPSVKSFTFNNASIVVLDNNFVIPHFEMMLRVPHPSMNILIPQALFNPSKTDKAVGVAQLRRLPSGKYEFSYEGTVILITTDKFGISKMEYSNGIVVERVGK